MFCIAACGTHDSSLTAVTDKKLSLGLVRVDPDSKEFNLLLCEWQKTYNREDLAKLCVPALVDEDGEAAIISYDFSSKRTQLQAGGTVKWAISVAVLAAIGYVIGKKIRKAVVHARHKNFDMSSLSNLQKIKLEADEHLSRAQVHLKSVQERFAAVKKLRKEHYYDNGIPPNNRRFIPLFRTTDFKSYDSLDKAFKRANKTVKTAEANASKANTMHENAKLLYQWNVDQSKDIAAFKSRLLKDLENINVNAVIVKDGKGGYTSMSVAKLRTLTGKHKEQLTKLKQELDTLPDNSKKRVKLQEKITAHEQMIASNIEVIADLKDAIRNLKQSDTPNTMSSNEYQNLHNTTLDEAAALKSNKSLQVATATFSALLISRLFEPLSFWGDDERRLAKHWHSLFYPYSDMDYATEAVIDIGATLNVIANQVFPQFRINPAAAQIITARGKAN